MYADFHRLRRECSVER